MVRKSTSTKPTTTRKRQPKKVEKKSFLKWIRNIVIYSFIMIVIGAATAKYQTKIYDFVTGDYKHVVERITNIGQTAKDFYTNPDLSKESESKDNTKPAPSSSSPVDNEIVKHQFYALGYNEGREQPNWVSYKLTADMILNKKVKRSNNFRADPSVKTGSAELADYRRSGYDRGHLCPAAAMAFNSTAMSESFYMSNMSPQKPELNRGAWKKLEGKVRGWAVKNKGIFVVTGPVFYLDRNHKEIGINKVDVPDAYYKVILDYTQPDIKTIGFILPNSKIDRPLSFYAVSVNDVEIITGLDFFAQLPDNTEERLENKADYNRWN